MSDFWERTLSMARALDEHDYYQLLGLPHGADPDAIRDAYYLRIRELHPDRHVRESDQDRKQAVVRLFARVGEAYRILSTPALREGYDQGLTQGKTRFDKSAVAAKKKRSGSDPANPQARTMYERARAMMAKDDRKGARAQLDLALQFDPESEAIAAAIAELSEAEQERLARFAQPQKPAPPSAPAEPAPAAATGSAPQPAKSEPAPRFTIRCTTDASAVSFFHGSVERGRLVLRTTTPLPPGSPVEIRVTLPQDQEISLTGQVAKVTEGAIGVRLDPVSAEIRAPFEAIMGVRPAPVSVEAATAPAAAAPAAPAEPAGATQNAPTKYEESLAILAEALRQQPTDRELRGAYYVTLAYLEKANGRTAEAMIHFETAIALDPRCSQAKRELRTLRRG